VPDLDFLVLLGDFNAHVGVDDSRWEGVIGRNGDASFNPNGRRLLDFCSANGLSIMNTYFRHRDIHKYTWRREYGGLKSMIDFVIVSSDLRSRVADVRVARGAELSTDHYLVVCRLLMSHAVGRIQKDRKVWRVRWERLKEARVAETFVDEVTSRFAQVPVDEADVETEWLLFKAGVIGAATVACGMKRVGGSSVGRRTPWFTEEVKLAVKGKKEAYKAWLSRPSLDSRRAYADAKRNVKLVVAASKVRSWEKFGEELESNFWDAPKVFWRTVRGLREGRRTEVRTIKDSRGRILTGPESVLDRWREYFRDLLNPVDHGHRVPEFGPVTEGSPTLAEVEVAVRSLKPGKAAGVDEIRPEMLKVLVADGLCWLTRVIQVAWRTGKTPLDWRTGVVVPLFKKGDQRDCSNYRGITLLSIPGKVYSRVLYGRISEVVDRQIQDEQCGFRGGRGTTDQLFVLQQVLEKSREYSRQVFISFVDLEKAYDRVDRGLLWDVLLEYGVGGPLVGAVASLSTKLFVKINLTKSQSLI
jgi:hypothetical protein